MRVPLRVSLAISAAALALFGLIRFVFNAVGVRAFGPEYVGDIGASVSGLTIVAVAIASVPSVLATKFVAEFRGANDVRRAERIFSGAVVATLLAGGVCTAALAAAGRPAGHPALVAYVALFGLYLVFKGTYFAFGIQKLYARAEAIGAAAFGIVFAVACAGRRTDWATASLLAQPACFALVAAYDHRRFFGARSGLAELVRDWRGYGAYSAASFVNAMSGLGSYHLLVVVASLRLDAAALGYLNVMLAALSPLSFIPTAYGAAAFPEMSLRHGEGDREGLRALIARSTRALQALAILSAGPLLVVPRAWLTLLHLPPRPDLVAAWCWLAVSIQIAMTSAPSGHHLNATRHIDRHALLSGFFLVTGVGVGSLALAAWGIAGAGIMRFAIDAPAAWGRMALSNRVVGWIGRDAPRLLGGQVAMGTILAIALLMPRWPVTAAVWVVLAIPQLPALGELARSVRSAPGS